MHHSRVWIKSSFNLILQPEDLSSSMIWRYLAIPGQLSSQEKLFLPVFAAFPRSSRVSEASVKTLFCHALSPICWNWTLPGPEMGFHICIKRPGDSSMASLAISSLCTGQQHCWPSCCKTGDFSGHAKYLYRSLLMLALSSCCKEWEGSLYLSGTLWISES